MHLRFRRERAPEEIDGVRIPYDKTRRGNHRLAWYLILGVVLSPFLYLGARALADSISRTANGAVELGEFEIRASEAGRVREVDIVPGDRIAAGQKLAALESVELDAALARNAAQIAGARVSLREAAMAREEGVRELALLDRSVQYQSDRRRAVEDLVLRGAATRAELDQATADLAGAQLAALRERRDLAAQTLVADAAPAERAVLERRRDALTEYAPFDGRTLSVLVKAGEFVPAGAALIIVGRLDRPRVIAYVSPKYATHLDVGTPATVYFADGARMQAVVASTPQITARMPPDLVDQFGLRPMTVVLELSSRERWGEAQRVQGLPVTVRFASPWERMPLGAWLGRALGWFAQ